SGPIIVEIPQVSYAGAQVLYRVIWVRCAEAFGGCRSKLHQSTRSCPRFIDFTKVRFLVNNGGKQAPIPTEQVCTLADQVVIRRQLIATQGGIVAVAANTRRVGTLVIPVVDNHECGL